MSTEEKLADYLSSTTYDDLPPEVTLASKKSIMDTLGVSLAGSSASGVKEIASLVKEWGGKPESTVFLYQAMVPAHEAALVNATMARALDFDDLEAGALELLERPEIGELWRERLQAVLVDEFQDTNERQRRIIDALVGEPLPASLSSRLQAHTLPAQVRT